MTNTLKPESIALSASSACQLRCPSCPTGTGKIQESIGTGYLKIVDFKKFTDKNPWVKHIELTHRGEVFLNPELLVILKDAHEKKISLAASGGANLNNVSDEVLEGMVRYQFRSITCSIDGASEETYQIYRVNGHFNAVIRNIKRINFFKKKYQSNHPKLSWQFVVFGHNEHELPVARKMAQELGMVFNPKLSWDEKFSPVRDKDFVRKESGLGVSSRTEYQEKYKTRYLQKSICRQLWVLPQINFDGRVLGCCVNLWGDFGNAFEAGLTEVLNNEKMEYTRKMLMGGKEERADIPCSACWNYIAMKKSRDWMRAQDIDKS